MEKKNILLITDSYPPEIRSASHGVYDLAKELYARGHRVSVVTCYPKHNLIPLHRSREYPPHAAEEGVEVFRVRTLPHKKVGYLRRAFAEITLPWFLWRAIRRSFSGSIDIVYVYSPPLPLVFVGKLVKNQYRAKLLLNIQDIFPQNAIDLGVLSKGLISQLYEMLEYFAYKVSDYLIVHSHGNRKFLIEHKGVSPVKIGIIPNWVDVESYKNVQQTGRFREKYGLKNKFVFLFAGVVGPSQDLDVVMQIAKNIHDMPEIHFLIVGNGTDLERIKARAHRYSLKNVQFEDFVSIEEYPALVKDIDVGLVCLSSKNKTPVIPAKIVGYMASAKPVVVFLHSASDGHQLLKDAQCGYSCDSDDLIRAESLVRRLYREKAQLSIYGDSGFLYASTYFDRRVCITSLEELFIGI